MNDSKCTTRFRQIVKAVLFLLSMFAVSCKEDETWDRPYDMSQFVPDYCFGCQGDFFTNASGLTIDLITKGQCELDFWDLQISYVEYYLNGKLLKTAKRSPYPVLYHDDNLIGEEHELVVKVYIEDLTNGNMIVKTRTYYPVDLPDETSK